MALHVSPTVGVTTEATLSVIIALYRIGEISDTPILQHQAKLQAVRDTGMIMARNPVPAIRSAMSVAIDGV
ncbi:MAG: hypothetical protein CYPHOPRED_005493 [Cyphobasidiales sp. Tagirdzhanova-0007]|nr:MAG: hypothetical protein CYPHOPRED_005493 [Cyphobasidiales sp. Tagirdzhanova-0007]